MAKTTIKTDLDFTLNPDNIAVGDWVASKIIGYDKVGQIHGYATQNKGMLKFWVMWSGQQFTSSELADNLRKIEPLERDYVGEELKNGRVRYLHYLKEEDRVIAEVCINGETDYWNIDKLQFNLNNLNSNETVDLDTLIIDKNLQQRVKINNDVVNDYCEAYKKGEKLPPITIWHCTDDGKTYLVDGFHRAEASLKAGLNHLPFIKFEGTYREALLFTLGVNAKHGLRRSNADKRKAVMTLLLDPEWTGWSNNKIAQKCNVSHTYVNNLRSKISNNEETTGNVSSGVAENNNGNLTGNVSSGVAENNNNDSENDENKRTYINKDGIKTTMDVSNIGKSKKPEKTSNNFAPNFDAQLDADLWNADNPNNGNDTVDADLDLPAELTKPIISDDSQPVKKPEKKPIQIQEGCNYQAGFGCRWYVEVLEEDFEGLKIYQEKNQNIRLGTAVTRFLVSENILIRDPTRPLEYIINHDYQNDDHEKDLQRNSLNLSPTTSRKLQEYINKHGEEAILKLLSDEKEK